MRALLLLVSLFTLSACLSGGGGPEVDIGPPAEGSNTPSAQAVATANTKLKSVADMLDGNTSASLSYTADYLGGRAALSTDWETSPGVPSLSNSGNSSLKQWMINQFDETFVNSNNAKVTFSGRISNSLDLFCYLANSGNTLEASTGLPPIGEHSVTLTQAMNDACGGGVDDDSIGAVINLTVTEVSGSALYNRSLSFEMPGTEECPFQVYVMVQGESFNIATAEDQNCDGRNHASLSVFKYNATTMKSHFTYISKDFSGAGNSGFEIYRGYLNEATDEAYIVGHYGGDSNGTAGGLNGVTYVAVGKPSAGGSVAISANTIGATIPDTFHQGCVDPGDLSIVTDNTVSCTLTGDDASDAFPNLIQATYNDLTAITDLTVLTGTTDVGFTDNSDMFAL